MAAVRYRSGDHDVVLGIDSCLHIVAHDATMVAASCHGAGIGVGERDLRVRGGFKLSVNFLEFPETPAQRCQSLLQVLDPRSGRSALRTVRFLKLGKIAGDALFDMGLPARQLALGLVLLVGVHGPKA